MRTSCVYPTLRTLGDVADCPTAQGKLPVASDSARGVDTRCLSELPNWRARGFLRSSVLPAVTLTPVRVPSALPLRIFMKLSRVRLIVVRTMVAAIKITHSNTLSTISTPPLLWRARYGYCGMRIT